jgi:hypothetical protein
MDLDPIYVEPRAVRALVPVTRPRTAGGIAKRVGSFLAKASGPSRIEPRKGQHDQGLQPLIALQQRGIAESPQRRDSAITMQTLKSLAERDDIIMAIRRTIRMAIGDMAWKIVPDLDTVKADLDQWEKKVLVNLALPGLDLEFVPQAMSLDIYHKAAGVLKDKLREVIKGGEDPSRAPEIRGFFENVVAAHEAIALSHVAPVNALLMRPNPTQTTLRSLLDLLIDDLTLYDAAVLVKNPTLDGKLGEIYNLPGEQITLYRAKDRNMPSPPNVGYDWSVDSKVRAFYNRDELTYLSINPQNDGYGKSPLESLVEQMVGSLYGDAYLLDGFANNNMPYGIFDLGPNVGPGEKLSVERAWDERVSSGQHRVIFVANKDGVKGFMPIQSSGDKDSPTIEKLKYWANRKCAAYGLGLGDIGFTEDIKAKATAENQSGLTQSRGVNSMIKGLAEQLNGGVLRGKMWLRTDPEDVNSLDGHTVACFPFGDVKLEFEDQSDDDLIDRAGRITALISGGIMTVNEGRKEEKLPPVAGGDTLVMSGAGLVKVEDLPNIPPPADPSQAPPGGAPGAPGAPKPGEPPKPPEKPGVPGQEDNAPPGPPKPPGADTKPGSPAAVAKAVNEVQRLARALSKMAGG